MRGEQLRGPRPGGIEVQPRPAGVDSDPRGDVEQGVADASWLGDAQFVVIDQLLQGDEQTAASNTSSTHVRLAV